MSNTFPFPHLPSKHTPIPSPLSLLTNPTIPTSWLWHSPTLGHQAFTALRASPTDEQQGHRLLHMHREPFLLFFFFFFFFLRFIYLLYVSVAVFRHSRRGSQISLRMVVSHRVVAGI